MRAIRCDRGCVEALGNIHAYRFYSAVFGRVRGQTHDFILLGFAFDDDTAVRQKPEGKAVMFSVERGRDIYLAVMAG